MWSLPQSEEDAVKLLQEHGILHPQRQCKNGHDAKLYFGKLIFWKCNIKNCQKKVSVRNNTWFEHSRLSFVTVLRFIFAWSQELTSIKWCEQNLKINKNTVIDWNNYLREVCVLNIEARNQGKIGGRGKIVEIDESLFSKRKNNAGRILPQQWIFGGLCRETKECFLVQVPDRTMTTLLNAILLNIKKGTTIYSDCWRAYNSSELEKAGFKHFTVNHSKNFVDPQSGAHTQSVERLWGSAKWQNKKHRGTARHHLKSYLAEFMWRQNANECKVTEILKTIKTQFPPLL